MAGRNYFVERVEEVFVSVHVGREMFNIQKELFFTGQRNYSSAILELFPEKTCIHVDRDENVFSYLLKCLRAQSLYAILECLTNILQQLCLEAEFFSFSGLAEELRQLVEQRLAPVIPEPLKKMYPVIVTETKVGTIDPGDTVTFTDVHIATHKLVAAAVLEFRAMDWSDSTNTFFQDDPDYCDTMHRFVGQWQLSVT